MLANGRPGGRPGADLDFYSPSGLLMAQVTWKWLDRKALPLLLAQVAHDTS